MSTKLVVLLISLFAAAVAGGVGIYYGTRSFEENRRSEQAAVPQEAPEAEDEAEPEKDAAEAAPEAPAGDTETAEAVPPRLDIIRVEPSGETVAAGTAAPGATVEMLIGGEVIASGKANEHGEWTLVPDQPIPEGAHDLVFRATGPDGEGGPVEGDRVAVVIEGPEETPMVAVSPPDAPSQVVQRPQADEPAEPAGEETEVARAGAPQGDESEGASQPEAGGDTEAPDGNAGTEAADDVADAGGADVNAAEAEAAVDSAEADAAPAADPAATQDETEVARAEPQQESGAAAAQQEDPAAPSQENGAASPEEESTAAAEEPAAASAEPDAAPDEDVPAGTSDTAASEPPAGDAPESGPSDTSDETGRVIIETVEVDPPADVHVSGVAEPEAPVRVYLNNEPVAETRADEGGRWAATVESKLPPGRYAVRADALDEEGQVEARAQVRFDRVQVAGADEPPPAREAEVPGDEPNTGGAETDMAAATEELQQQAETEVASAGEDGAGGTASDSRDAVAVEDVAGAEVAPVSDAPLEVNIVRGDNLWTIARTIYGEGVRYTVIYEANRNQIADPDLIYPGQIFTVPLPDETDQ